MEWWFGVPWLSIEDDDPGWSWSDGLGSSGDDEERSNEGNEKMRASLSINILCLAACLFSRLRVTH